MGKMLIWLMHLLFKHESEGIRSELFSIQVAQTNLKLKIIEEVVKKELINHHWRSAPTRDRIA
jgi:hypothetical protein